MASAIDLTPYLSPVGTVANVSGGATVGIPDATGITVIPAYTAIAGTATITVTPTFGGCTGTPTTFTVTVNPLPTVAVIADYSVCAG